MFDKKEFKRILEQALGDRNNSQYERDSGVNRTYISKYLNERLDSPPTPDIIRRLANAAQNGVTYEDLMSVAGHIEKQSTTAGIPEGLIKRDMKSIENDLKKMMQEIKTNPNEGIAAYGGEIDDDDLELLESAFRTALTVVKKINKDKYTPKKYKKDNI